MNKVIIKDYKNIKEIKFNSAPNLINCSIFSFNSESETLRTLELYFITQKLVKMRYAPMENKILKLIKLRKHFSRDNIVFNGTTCD